MSKANGGWSTFTLWGFKEREGGGGGGVKLILYTNQWWLVAYCTAFKENTGGYTCHYQTPVSQDGRGKQYKLSLTPIM